MSALALLGFAGCGSSPASGSCRSSAECGPGRRCVSGACEEARAPDGSVEDAAVEACARTCASTCCAEGERCGAGGTLCVPDLGPCAEDGECLDDSYCDEGRCTPYGTLPRGDSNRACRRPVEAGRFAPAVQCAWSGPTDGVAPGFVQVESTPLVMDFRIGRGPDDPVRPSIVFVSTDSFAYGDRGLVRIIDGRTCVDQGALAEPVDRVGAATTPALGDLDGDGSTPEIVAKSAEGGLVAFEYDAEGGTFRRRWFSTDESGERDRLGGASAIPSLSLADLDDDGRPEILMGGIVYSPDGVLLDVGRGLHEIVGYSQPAVIADVDHDGDAEFVTGNALADWSIDEARWIPRDGLEGLGDGFVAVADFGDFPSAEGDFPGGPEIGVVSAGTLRVQSIGGSVVFGPVALPGGSHGGNPTVADFDGDGRAEIACGGPGSLTVFDLDCAAEGVVGACASDRTDGILWSETVRDFSSGINGSSVFDFEGDGRAELVYADECFLRVFDGETGATLWSVPRSSGTWIEAPVIADADGDYNAELIASSNSAHGTCPSVDPLHRGLGCAVSEDCPGGSCVDGLCRCESDAECGDEGHACSEALPATPGVGSVCRAVFTNSLVGIRVYADASDRWVSSRRVWNQHAYAVTNIGEGGAVPRTSEVQRNWSEPALNDFRRNVQGDLEPLAGPDLTIGRGSFERSCEMAAPVIPLSAEVCNRGAEPVDSGMVARFYDGDPREGGAVVCSAQTVGVLRPGLCEPVACDWDPAPTEGRRDVWLWVDAEDENVECVESNNIARIASVGCLLI